MGNKILSLYLTRLTCLDETEHEGLCPFCGEGIANDAIRFNASITSKKGNNPPVQEQTSTFNLGDNYQDRTSVVLNQRVFSTKLTADTDYPFVATATLVLGEEDWGGNFDGQVRNILDQLRGESVRVVSAAATAAAGGAIGSALGPLGTLVGTGIGAAAGLLINLVFDGIDSLQSDVWAPKDVGLVVDRNAPSIIHWQQVEFAYDPNRPQFRDLGGTYHLDLEWRLEEERIPLNLYWHGSFADNFSASARESLPSGYGFVRIEGYIFSSQEPGTVPLELYWHQGRGDYFTTATEIGKRDARAAGYTFVRTEGYVYPFRVPGTVPLRLYWHPHREDNFSTATDIGADSAIGAGYSYVRDEGYIFPVPRIRPLFPAPLPAVSPLS